MSYENYEMQIANLEDEIKELEKANNHLRIRCSDIEKNLNE